MCTSDGWRRLVRMYLFEMWQQWFFESTTEPAQMAFEWAMCYGFFIDTTETLIWHHFIGHCCCCCWCCSGGEIRFNLHFSYSHRRYYLNLCCFYYGFINAQMMIMMVQPMVIDCHCCQFISVFYRFGYNVKMLSTRLLLFMRCFIKCCLN